jgi:integrase/recombinase XerD
MLTVQTNLQPKITAAISDDEILTMWSAQKSSATQKTYFYVISQFRSVLEKELRQVTFEDLLHWMDSLAGQSQNTKRNKIAVIKSLFGFAHKIGYLPVNPAQLLKQPKENDCRVERILTKSQVKAITADCPAYRDEMIIKALYVLGLRVTELVEMQWDNFTQTDEGMKLKVMGKGGKVRFLIVPANLYRDLVELRTDSAYVFSSRKGNNGGKLSRVQVYRVVKEMGDRQYIKVSPHYLRHSHATHSLSNGCDLNLLSTSLGHGNIAITSRYLHASSNDGSANYIDI